ncbi:hypothetical protein NsoK4_07840 [Nitrosopumilus sp. K4]|uniref:hypothetical protein n=1 Tax=Nitrosopumilus sp. K4 TaxID=2795383 RepID=UPI001BA5EECE|nr:hypothetical protein [Nitrosopumilus sp. K4]QUC64330.1 hypothetical protein NsoK4_07840 [Nitrosopumilus sp. K4]
MQNVIFLFAFFFFIIFLIPLGDSFAQSVIPPRHQWKQVNDIDHLTCKEGLLLLQKSNGAPACVSTTTYLKLVDRGYGMFDNAIMMKRPAMLTNLMETMSSNYDLMHHWHNMMQNDPTMMKNTMQKWISKMKENPEFLKNMIGPMTSDPILREDMIKHMRNHPIMEQSLKDHPMWMKSVHDKIMGPEMGSGMHKMCPWCPEYEVHVSHRQQLGFTNSDRMMNMMHSLWINDQISEDIHEFMLENPNHMAQMSKQMMGPMLGFMMDDPEIRQKMIELMLEHEEFMNSIRHENTR